MSHIDVLIIGANAASLTLANFLASHGVSVRILDTSPTLSTNTQSTLIHARTLEMFNSIGIAERIISDGHQVKHMTVRTAQQERIHLDLSQLEHTRYPYALTITQDRIEKVLINNLATSDIAVESQTTIHQVSQEKDRISLDITCENGEQETVTATYLIGLDDTEHETDTDSNPLFWVQVDVELETLLPNYEISIHSSDSGMCILTPIGDISTKQYHINYLQNSEAEHHLPTLNDVQNRLNAIGINTRIRELLSAVRISKMAVKPQETTYRQGRLIVLSDTADTQLPLLGQGINLGIADAFNLAWKLAMVINRQSPDKLLDSYQEERYPISEQVHRLTNRLVATLNLRQSSWKRTLREMLIPTIDTFDPAKRYIIQQLSQLAHHYKDASTVRGQDGNLRAGQRLPNYSYVDVNGASDLYTHLDAKRHTLFIIGDALDLADLAVLIQTQYTSTIAVRLVRTSPIAEMPCPVLADISRQLPLKPELAYLIRPDQIIGLISTVQEMRAGAHQMFAQRS